MLEKNRDEGTGYFAGSVIEKNYQQKIVNLAEGIIDQVEAKREQKGNSKKPAEINGENLNLYLQEHAYKHIDKNGYLVIGDLNYLSASGILYSYFYALFANKTPKKSKKTPEEQDAKKSTQIEIDIVATKQKIKSAKTAEEFTSAVTEFYRLTNILREIRTIQYGSEERAEKLDNLSALDKRYYLRDDEDKSIYGQLQGSDIIPWNNLAEIAVRDESVKVDIVKFLQRNGIEDFRLTHNLPYVRMGYQQCCSITVAGELSEKTVPEYELDFAANRELVTQAYVYIKAYFENEESLIDNKCSDALNITDKDFKEFETTTDSFNKHSLAHKKTYDFISLFNALPKQNKDFDDSDSTKIFSFISDEYQTQHPIPGSTKKWSRWGDGLNFQFTKDLLSFQNPIFQSYFGENFGAELLAKKEQQQQRMFDTAFALLNKSMMTWQDIAPKLEKLRKKSQDLLTQIWELPDGKDKEAKDKKRRRLEKKISYYREKEDRASSVIYNFLYSIFESNRYASNLHSLKPEQNKILADFAIKDHAGVIIQLMGAAGYENFCDFLTVLENQTDLAIAGDYRLSETMQIIADKYKYQKAENKEQLKDFIDKNAANKHRDENSYAWYLHMFDIMQHLEKTPSINIDGLATALIKIRQGERSSRGNDPQKIVHARYRNYIKFVTQSNFVALASRAIDFQENYEGLTCDELRATADKLIAMRKELEKIFSGKSDYSYAFNDKSDIKPLQKEFLDLVDVNINLILKRVEKQALLKDNALEKITDLFLLHNARGRYESGETARAPYLKKINEEDNNLKYISSLSEQKSFWPEDVYDHLKAFVFAKNTFVDDRDLEDKILNDILIKLDALPPGRKKSDCLYILIDKNMRAAYPETRDKVFDIYTEDVFGKLGKDDRSKKYQNRLAVYLKALATDTAKDWDVGKRSGYREEGLLSNTISSADKYLLLKRLSDKILSQETTSHMIKEACAIKLNSDDMVRSYLHGIGVDYLTEEMDRDPEVANKFIQFLNSKGEKKDCNELSSYIEKTMKVKYAKWESRLDPILRNTKPSNCKIFYENFWSAPLEARAVVTARMLKSATSKGEEDTSYASRSWEEALDLVMDNLIRPDDDSIEAKYARDIMHSYIKSRSDYERVLIMSAMMVANRNIGNDAGNVGKALKLFLENMGPAEIKLGQAIASHPNTPEKIKAELQHLKSAADIPPRWTLYDWIIAENIPEEFWKDEYLGEVMGSASYYTSIALGEDGLLRILRPEAREKAAKGFRVIPATVEDLRVKERATGKSYGELTSSVEEMITQAARMSEIETDHDIGQQQYEYAKAIYNGVTIRSGPESFAFKVMDWRAKGQNWIIMDRAIGPTFNALPENKPAEIAHKRNFAKGYIIFELQNILSGKKFDHDKHGAQLSINPQTNAVGIYDTGAMALHDPSPAEQGLLGNVLYKVLKGVTQGGDVIPLLSRSLAAKIEELHASKADAQYLVEVKKGLLALGDFFSVLKAEDLKGILQSIDLSNSLSKDIYNGMIQKMSLFEKAQLRGLQALQTAQGEQDIVIQRNKAAPQPAANVINITAERIARDKASWLKDAFAKPDDGNMQSEPSSLTAKTPSCNIC